MKFQVFMKSKVLTAPLLALWFLGLTTPVKAEKETLDLWPTSQWSVDALDTKCRLSRTFGSGENQTVLWIEKGSADAAYNLTLIGRPFRHPFGSKVSVQFAPEPEYERAYLTAKSSAGRPVISLFGAHFTPTPTERDADQDAIVDDKVETVDYGDPAYTSTGAIDFADAAERLRAINQLRLGGALMNPVSLTTGPLEKPLASLHECVTRLEERITRDIENAASPTEPVDIERWAGILQRSYPTQMLREKEEGRIGVNLTIGKDGRPGHCEVLSVVGPTSFNDTVCLLLLRHATFEPARDANGDPLVSRYRTRVTFRLND